MRNLDARTVKGFGEEWSQFDQDSLGEKELGSIFADYFSLLPSGVLNKSAVGADVGCGSGRWAAQIAPLVRSLWAVDASEGALRVAERRLGKFSNVIVAKGIIGELPFSEQSLDFAYSLGVLHHIPDTAAAIAELAEKLKDDAPILLYLYYNFENRPLAFRLLWRASDFLRRLIAIFPRRVKFLVCDLLAASVYWPLARTAAALEAIFGQSPRNWPLRYYRDKSFYVMRTDSLDRFGTSLEKRFSRSEIRKMLQLAGFHQITFSDAQPYWTVSARRKKRL